MKQTMNSRLFIRFFASYILIMLIPSFFFISQLRSTKEILIDKEIQSTTASLNQVSIIMDRRIDEVKLVFEQIVNDPSVIRLASMTDPYDGKNAYSIYDAVKRMHDLYSYNQFIEFYFFTFDKNDLVLCPDSGYHWNNFTSNFLTFEGKSSTDILESYIDKNLNTFTIKAIDAKINESEGRFLVYAKSFGQNGAKKGYAYMLIDEEYITNLTKEFVLNEDSKIFIKDNTDQLISKYPFESTFNKEYEIDEDNTYKVAEIDGIKKLIMEIKSPINNWSYYTVQSYEYIMKPVNKMRNEMFIFYAIIVFLGLILSIYFAKINVKPVSHIVESIAPISNESPTSDSAYEYIEKTLKNLYSNNSYLKNKIDTQLPFMQRAFWDMALHGNILPNDNIDIISKSIDYEIKDSSFIIIVVLFKEYKNCINPNQVPELYKKKALFKSVLQDLTTSNVYFYDTFNDSQVFILDTNSIDLDNLLTILKSIKEKTEKIINIDTVWYVSEVATRISEVSKVYEPLSASLKILDRNESGIVFFSSIPTIDKIYFPYELENRLLHATVSGQTDLAIEILNELFHNESNLNLVAEIRFLLYNHLSESMLNIQSQLAIKDPDLSNDIYSYIKKIHQVSLVELEEGAIKIFKKMCQTAINGKKSHNHKLLKKIIKLMNKHYKDNTFNICMLAKECNISEVYLSNFIKEQTSKTYSEMLESIRMEKASELLISTTKNIKQISKECGYTSHSSFSRAFKRIHGINATQYRNNS